MKRLALVIAMIAGYLSIALPSFADEPAQEFLEALRDNGYHDVAIEYLTGLKESDLVSAEFKSALPFELAQTLISSTLEMRDLGNIEARLDQAQGLLTEYASGDQSLEVSGRTLHYQGNLLLRRSNIYITQSESDRLTVEEKNELFVKARTNLQSALESYENARSQIRKLIDPNSPESIKIDPQDPSTRKKRDQFQGVYAQVRFKLPQVSEQLADTYEPGSAEYLKLLTSARDEYKKVWDAYPRYLAGLESCVYSARCSHKLGEHKQALELLAEIFSLGDNSVFKPIKLKAYVLATQCWEKIEPYPYNEIVIRLEPAVRLLNKLEVKQFDWLRVQMELAIAQREKAAEIKAKGGPTSNRDGKTMEREAAKVLRNVARFPSPLRDRAKQMLSEWDVSITMAETELKPPASFEDARERGKEIVSDIEVVVVEAAQVGKQMAAETDPAKKAELQQNHGELKQQVDTLSRSALQMFDTALNLSDDSTIRADINNVRYLQCYCYFANEKYIEAALIGEFLLAKYPNVDGTKQAMTLLIQSYSILMDRAQGEDRAFERGRLTNASDSVINRWPGSNECGAAASAMTRLGLNEKNFELARKYFNEIPGEASYRNRIGVRVGQRMWLDFNEKFKASGEASEAMATQLNDAMQLLTDGVNDVPIDDLDFDTALGALYLVEVLLQRGEIEKAVERLEIAAIAPLDLVKQKHPAITETTMADVYRRKTYQVAITAYLAAMDGNSDQQKWVDKAAGIIDAMREEMKASQDPKDRERITGIYQRIARQLKENFEAIKDAGKQKKFAESMSSFLGSIEAEANDARTILWAGSTLLTVADALTQSGLNAEAIPLFTQAVSALDKAEQIGFDDDAKESAKLLLELKRQRALAQRGSGQFEAAIDQIVDILNESPNSLAVQMDAAETLQLWGKAKNDSQRYIESVKGARPFKDPKTKRSRNLIWGWEDIALATRSKSNLRNTFYESLYHVVECRLEYGVIASKPGAISAAGNEIVKERRRDPTFNGDEKWKSKFEELEKRVNEAKK